ncbi:MAG TPA: trypsin-like peptidase domain-containing protein [Solirubrobacteraceae bacterium]|nr:trypsin-like peptidase domain-containing protein [Solirubrobacteraceae bacterium]
MTKSRPSWPVVLLAALVGGVAAVALTAALGVDGGGTTTTIVRQSPLAASSTLSPAAAEKAGAGLTARDIYKADAPGVVYIRANVVEQSTSPFGFPQQQQGEATGSGFVIDKNGSILTNAHVVDGATKVTVQFEDNKTVTAKIVGKDRSSDLALLKVDPSGLNLQPLSLGSAQDVQVGDPVVAIGNPFGLDRTLTTGVVSAKQRQIQGLNGFAIDNVIQTDAAINPGNSGGPLIDSAGKVIGINSQIETGSSSKGNVGIGFAVPIDTAKKLLPELEKGATITTGYLGISARTIDSSLSSLNLPVSSGALVEVVQPGSPAAKAGIHAGDVPLQLNGESLTLGGDIIVKVDGKPITSSDGLSAYIASRRKGDTVKVEVVRNGKHRTFSVVLAARPQSTLSATQAQTTP